MTEPLRADLVLEGGGVKGIALAGAVVELLGRYRFRRVAGTSAGAVAAAFVAAGLDGDGLRAALDRLDYSRVPDSWQPVPGLSQAGGVLLREGAPRPLPARVAAPELAEAGVVTFGDLSREDAGDDPTSPTGSATSWS